MRYSPSICDHGRFAGCYAPKKRYQLTPSLLEVASGRSSTEAVVVRSTTFSGDRSAFSHIKEL